MRVIAQSWPDMNSEIFEKHYTMPTIFFDESYSTTMARHELRDLRRDRILSRRIKRGQVDSMAAKIILEQWLKLETLG